MKLLFLAATLTCCLSACSNKPQTQSAASEIEALVQQYYDDIGTYDYAGMMAVCTPQFEMLDDGQRVDVEAFEQIVRGLEARNLAWQFQLSEFNTQIASTIAYTSYLITSQPVRWYGSAVLKRSDGEWLIDRMAMMRQPEFRDVRLSPDNEG